MNLQDSITIFLEKHTEGLEGLAVKDLKLNFEKLTSSSILSEDELCLLLAALGKTLEFSNLQMLGVELANSIQIPHEQINEALQIPAIMGMLNTYYKFRFFAERNDTKAVTDYGTPGLRMNSLAKPLMGKEKFELISLAVSILNSCEKCVVSHEKAVMDLGVNRSKIHEFMKLTAVAKGLKHLR
ncbi:carboxymuconolactone decarboxylase family protein [Silvanigrella aquatica]|uniref:Carboxymuconolactone decarboxylase-like domain-containing protein n=1 Tax=Silvanigrella aquatica TaxID=1915309 RepID=A0A1L4CZM8_9BACT|nr:carboxymuconolactone decarboxylase family protein [Silvanigrella aquatica]APJ03400.1 hypothetical protein AXG55_05565 [Silvanigrella aquatica]